MENRLGARLIRLAAGAAGALALIYLIGANLILNSKILDKVVNKTPQKTLVEWESGWTILPGFIHVEGLRVRGQSKGQQWQFRLGEADVRMSLLALPGKKVRASRVRGKSFHFRQRRRLTAETQDFEGVSHYPPIEGLSNPPDPAPEDIYPPKKTKRGWQIDVADVYLEEDIELWVGDLKMTGRGTVTGGIDYRIREEMLIPRAIFDLDDGELVIRGTTFVDDLHIATDLSIGPFAPKESRGLDIFDHILGSFDLENGRVPDLEVANSLLPGDGLELVDGTASFNWSFDKESVEAGSNGRIGLAAVGASMLMAGRAVSGDLALELRLLGGGLAQGRWELGQTSLSLDNMDIHLLRADDELVDEGPGDGGEDDLWWARFTLETGRLDIGEPSEIAVTFGFELKNTEPLLHLFLAKEKKDGAAKLPLWVKLTPDVQNVSGRGRIDMSEDHVLVDDILIDGDHFDLTAWLESRAGVANGKLYLRYKKLDLGLDIEDGRKDLKILRPKQWALEQPELDHSAVEDPPAGSEAGLP